MKKLSVLGIVGGAALLTAAPFSLQWSQQSATLSLDSANARIGRPATATSVAGAHRRAYRRTYRRAAYGAAAAYGVGSYYGTYSYPGYSSSYPSYSYPSYSSSYPSYSYSSPGYSYGYPAYSYGAPAYYGYPRSWRGPAGYY
jgi:hypothetical protein